MLSATPSKEVKLKRDNQVMQAFAPNTLIGHLLKASTFSSRNSKQTKKGCIDLIVKMHLLCYSIIFNLKAFATI